MRIRYYLYGFIRTIFISNDIDSSDYGGEAAKKEKDNYFIYLVNNALNEKRKVFEIIQNPSKLVEEKKIDISTAVFELKL